MNIWSDKEEKWQIWSKYEIKIPDSTYLAKFCWLDKTLNGGIEMGENCTICEGTRILTHDASATIVGLPARFGKVKIGNKVFIGVNSIILMGRTIGDNVIIGAGSVVANNIPSNEVWGGNPAHFLKTLEQFKEENNKKDTGKK